MRSFPTRLSILALAPVLVFAAAASPAAAAPASSSAPSLPHPAGVAVVELFTSEGCSSCPPADRLLAALSAEAARAGRLLFALSFHVDYWNSLGWDDPFSRSAYTDRQRAYASALGGGMYTPEMIVNGSEAMVGSDAARARRAVARALAGPARAAFRDLGAEAARGNVRVTFAIAGAGSSGAAAPPPGTVIRLALVQPDTAVAVGRGENGGRTLAHHNVVRAFATARPGSDGTGEARMPLPAGARPGAWRLIAYAQDPGSLEVLGAAETGIKVPD